jgi:Mycothiol maleylpyruvate isomerase N-terminal domain
MDWSWAGPPLDTRPLFPSERAEFTALLWNLPSGGWQRPTNCPGWRVHDVVSHVVHDYLRKLSRTRDRLSGSSPPRQEPVALLAQQFLKYRWGHCEQALGGETADDGCP